MNEPCPKCGEYHNNCYKLKNLTDEEINEIWHDHEDWEPIAPLSFARAILRKANEK